jgi:D-alanyl-lipoteichoic acid acyltransferase DltB (MBOAT superfamily)
MVFNSYQFILIFLPVTYLAFLLAHRLGGWPWAINLLAAASLAFYGLFGIPLLVVLAGSILFNYTAGTVISCLGAHPKVARNALFGAIGANLVLLGYLKYTNFLIDVATQVTGIGIDHAELIVPIGVSFFTFVQIGYLIDAYNGQLIPTSFGRYIVFSAFFPCVTAGPLVLQREMMEQMAERKDPAFDLNRLVIGLTMFGMGLFKKVALADSIAPFANTVFDGVGGGGTADLATAWLGALCYALQLYFDFSGYSDMAIGLGYMFGIRLPLNFDSPFKATNISDFWRRWHMTMTRFFTSYIYSALAMNGMRAAIASGASPGRKFLQAAAIPVVVTFLVAGIWHGAGWTFVIYGLIHGVAIAVNLAWRDFQMPKIPAVLGWALTMCVVLSGLVVFRAHDLATAGTILAHMWGLGELGLAGQVAPVAGLDIVRSTSMIILLGAIVLLLPNTQQILHRYWVSSDEKPAAAAWAAGLLTWRPAFAGAVAMGFALTVALTSIGADSSFLYYQF